MRRIQGLCCLLLLGLAGCGFFVPQTNSGGGTNTGDYIYVGNGNNTYIAGFGVSSSGALSVLSNSPLQQRGGRTIAGSDARQYVSVRRNDQRHLCLRHQ